MNGNRFGRLFQVTTYGESHGEAMGVTVLDCLPKGDGLCVALEWSLPRDLPVPDNVIQSDRVGLEVAFAVFDCTTATST